ncbi:MAG: hypothetical protein, partial [Olavius algarvensis Gamma 1 endosymbiont]
ASLEFIDLIAACRSLRWGLGRGHCLRRRRGAAIPGYAMGPGAI